MMDAMMEVTEGVGEVVVTIQRTGDLISDLTVYCYIDRGNAIGLMQVNAMKSISLVT